MQNCRTIVHVIPCLALLLLPATPALAQDTADVPLPPAAQEPDADIHALERQLQELKIKRANDRRAQARNVQPATQRRNNLARRSGTSGGFERNPDRFASVGFTFAGYVNADGTSNTIPATRTHTYSIGGNAWKFDMRIPISNVTTLTGSIGGSTFSLTEKQSALYYGQTQESSDITFSIGVRFYLTQ